MDIDEPHLLALTLTLTALGGSAHTFLKTFNSKSP
jgi:hypothetical protein